MSLDLCWPPWRLWSFLDDSHCREALRHHAAQNPGTRPGDAAAGRELPPVEVEMPGLVCVPSSVRRAAATPPPPTPTKPKNLFQVMLQQGVSCRRWKSKCRVW